MTGNSNIRPVNPEDIDILKTIIEQNNLFPYELLDNMISPYFKQECKTDFWITYMDNDKPVAIAYYAPERMTEGTYNLYLIAVSPDYQGKGIGKKLLIYIENHLKYRGERILLIETSGLPAFKDSRKFYRMNNYHQEAVIREFYAQGDDKVVFWKKL